MIKSLLCLLACVALAAGNEVDPTARMKELVPDVERSLKTDRTYLFSRSQWKYGLQRDDYLSFWIDRPLRVDPSLRAADGATLHGLSSASFVKTRDTVLAYGLDGLAFFPETSGRMAVFDQAARNPNEAFRLLSELTGENYGTSKLEALQKALQAPASFRIGNRLVVTSYGADQKTPEEWKAILARLKAEVGDTFLFLPSLTRFGNEPIFVWQEKFHAGSVTREDVGTIRRSLREWLRVGDGLHFPLAALIKTRERKFDDLFYREFLVRLTKSVLAEPEFQEKYLGLSALVGHENVTRLGYTHSSDGTRTLRRSMEAALAAQPEILNIPEWDEQNENTSLRPTIHNGTSSQRIMRYYAAQIRGIDLRPIPGDRVELPNLVMSYRKTLMLGEKVEVELLNVPDGSGKGSYTVRLTLEDETGKVLHRSQELAFEREKLEEHRITLPSETFNEAVALVPRLEVRENDRRTVYDRGWHHLALRPSWNWDYKWVKQPLRDLMTPEEVAFEVGPPGDDGVRKVSASYRGEEPLAYLEVLDEDDTVCLHGAGDPWREDAEQVILSLYWQAETPGSQAPVLEGSLSLRHAEGRWLVPEGGAVLKGQKLERLTASLKPQRVLIALPRSAVDDAELEIRLPGVHEGRIAVAKIMREGMFGFDGPGRLSLVISRYLRQYRMPLHLGKKEGSLAVPLHPDLPFSILHLQAVAKSGRIFRGRPVCVGTPTGERKTITVYSDTAQRPVEISVDAARVPRLRYPFDGVKGTVLETAAGRTLSGILGDRTTLVVERGGAQSGDGTPFFRGSGYPENASHAAPQWSVDAEGRRVLKFDGEGRFITLPQGAIPRRAAFTVAMEIKPEKAEGREVLIANRARYPGTVTIYRENEWLKADFLNERGESVANAPLGVKLPAGKWAKLVISYDQAQLQASVDGQPGRVVAIGGPGSYDTVSVVGGFGRDWFTGEIRSFEIDHGVAEIAPERKETP
ncbi:MAG TPA: LamG-like jellyroll fold domain-containing protein [Chthoniobacteraceae bacterium]|nr:LamG-like jellyroll fold domain-containing protein [Chthoniobacteraceae bacterium]